MSTVTSPRKPTTAKPGTGCCRKPDCSGPQCLGLECFERPRFYAGQLLTETELNGLSDYLRAKNRLHNLHLHGWGVVCGLGVSCHPCEGWVTVESGYALDPCGNDIVVCEPHDVDIAEIIRQCKKARRRIDCERPRRVRDRQEIEHWCLTLRYAEQEARPKAVLRKEDTGGSCGCGGSGGSCACGGHGSHGRSASCDRKPGGPCEPTRILESYRIELCQADGPCQGPETSAGEQAWVDQFRRCFEIVQRSVGRLPTRETATLGRLTVNDWSGDAVREPFPAESAVVIHTSFCRVRDALRELIRRHPPKTACYLLEEIDRLECPEPPTGDPDGTGVSTAPGYWNDTARNPTRDLAGILVRYLVDCLCHATLPPCAPCCDDEVVVLACMEVRDGRVLRICNHSCRRLAGAFPPSLGGIYLGPLMPLVTRLLGVFCCGDFLRDLFDRVDRSDDLQGGVNYLAADDFARTRFAGDLVSNFQLGQLFGDSSRTLNTASLVGQPLDAVQVRADELQVQVEERPLDAEVDLASLGSSLTTLQGVRAGQPVVAFTQEGKVVGFAAPRSVGETVVDQGATIQRLERRLDDLRRVVLPDDAGNEEG